MSSQGEGKVLHANKLNARAVVIWIAHHRILNARCIAYFVRERWSGSVRKFYKYVDKVLVLIDWEELNNIMVTS